MKLRYSFFLFLLLLVKTASAQDNGMVGLSAYRLPLNKKGVKIAEPFTTKGGGLQLKIIDDPARLFRVKNNALYLKKNRQITEKNREIAYPLKFSVGGVVVTAELVADRFIKNKVIAHRGAWKNQEVSENSLGSLRKAIELGCEGTEFDVWLSADGTPVISHDASIGGHVVENTPVAELRKVPLKAGEFVPTLEQYLQLGKTQNTTTLVLEIKPSAKGKAAMLATVDSVMNMVARHHAQGWVKYISFSYDALLRVRQLDPFADISYLTGDKTVEEVKKDGMNGIDYSFYSYEGDTNLVKKAHTLGLTVNVWTVNDTGRLQRFLKDGVDMITTDEPELLLKMIKEQAN